MIRDELNEAGSFWLKAVISRADDNNDEEIAGFVKWSVVLEL
jgi:hypothetical protein